MARFPHYKRNAVEIGRILARARTDEAFRSRLSENPKEELGKIGLPESVLHLIEFEIIDAKNEKVVALPYKLNESKLEQKDPEYLRSIAREYTSIN
ncbi:MAG: hypothetical protein ABJL55_10630 [Roseibium sp.]